MAPDGKPLARPPPASAVPVAWVRARRPEQKRERRQAILAAAEELLDRGGVEAATLSAISRGTNLSKTHCYRYFESREAILLALALGEFQAWIEAAETGLAPLARSGDVDGTAEVIARVTVGRPRLCMLVGSLAAVLERNVDPDTVIDFKRRTAELQAQAETALVSALPTLRAEAATAFYRLFNLGLAGAWPAANPAPVLAEILARREFEGIRVDLEATLRELACALLRGLMAGPS